MVPNGWVEKPLKDICKKTISYGIVQTGENIGNGIPCVRVVDLSKNTLNPNEMIKTSDEIHQSYKKTILCEGELMIALRGEIGLVKKVTPELIGANITRGLARLSPIKSVDSDYLLWTLRSNKIKNELARKSGGSALQEIALGSLRKVVLPIPPLPEQRKIAKILSTWDKAIAATERLIATSQQQKKALMQQLLTGKKRLVNSETGMAFEGDWQEVNQGSVATFFNGRAYKQTEWEETGTPVIRLQNLTGRGSEFYYSTLELPDHQYCNSGDLLYMWSATFGPAIWHGGKALYHYHIWKVECNASRLNKMFMYFLLDFETQKWMSQSNGMGLLHITKTTMEKQKILLPNIKEQQKIASVLTAADKEIELLQAKLAHLKDEKKALMQQLLTGKRRVKIDAAEAA